MNVQTILVLITLALSSSLVNSSCPKECRCQLDRIDCSGQKLTQVPKLDGPERLVKYLNLSNNRISGLDESDFSNYSELKWLDLGNNRIEGININNRTFANNYELEWLDLSSNPLRVLDKLVLNKIRTLNISTCSISNIPYSTKFDLFTVENLDLSNNYFSNSPSFYSPFNLKRLVLSKNPIRSMYSSELNNLPKLEILEVSEMYMLNEFQLEIATLKQLHLNNNTRISNPFNYYRNRFPNLEVLSIRNNGLKRLSPEAQKWCSLKSLDIRDNPFICNCRLDFIKKCNNLVGEIDCDPIETARNSGIWPWSYNPCSYWWLVGQVLSYLAAVIVIGGIIFTVIRMRGRAKRAVIRLGHFCSNTVAEKFIVRSNICDKLLEDEQFIAQLKLKLLGEGEEEKLVQMS